MRIAIVALLCVLVLCAGCNTVPVTDEQAPETVSSSSGLTPAVAVLIVVLGLLLGASLDGG